MPNPLSSQTMPGTDRRLPPTLRPSGVASEALTALLQRERASYI